MPMLVHLPGAYRAAQIFGTAYGAAPLSHQYAMELMAQAVERDVSYRSRPAEETRRALEDSWQWVSSSMDRYPLAAMRLLPPSLLNFLQDRKASEILRPPARISDAPISPRTAVVPAPPSRLPLIMWGEKDSQPLLAEWNAQVAGLQALIDKEPAGEIRDPKLLSAAYFYQTAQAAMRLAYFDELTGLRNRHELDRLTPQLEAQLLRMKKNTPGDFFLMADIDHFKRVNDTHGHPAGDKVLQKVAKRLFELLRPGDFVFRLGGEEFLIYLAQLGEEGVRKVSQKIRREIGELDIPVPELEKPLRVTISIGAAKFRTLSPQELEHPDLPKTPVSRAIEESDRALYRAKNRGRNRVAYFWKK